MDSAFGAAGEEPAYCPAGPTYTAQDVLFTGWRVNVRPQAAKTCDGKKHLCEEADGRIYTIRVCTTDAAGLRTCQELEVEVPLLGKNPWAGPHLEGLQRHVPREAVIDPVGLWQAQCHLRSPRPTK